MARHTEKDQTIGYRHLEHRDRNRKREQDRCNSPAPPASTITTESLVTHATERWTLSVNTAGMVSVVHVRV
jgi:hypothetical protein